MNPLYNTFNQMPGRMGQMQNVIQQFRQFKQTFRGDPRQQIQQLLNSGKVSQAQYNQAVQMANQFRQLLGG